MNDKTIQVSGTSILLLLISTSLMVWYMHFREIDIPKQAPRAELHSQIMEKTAPSPYRYRILVPYGAEALAKLAGPVLGERRALLAAYGLIEAAALVALILILYRFCLFFFLPVPSLVGALIANLSLVVALRDHYFQPWSLVNAVVFALAAVLLYKRKVFPFAVLVLVAAFNRETSLLLPFLYLCTHARREKPSRIAITFVILCSLAGGGYLLVRALQGSAPHIYQLSDILRKNIAPKYFGFMALNLALFLGFVWMFSVRGFGRAPAFIRRLALFVPLYMLLVLMFGVWKEVRLLMPLYPVLIPAALAYLFPSGRRDDPPA
jgi:hypothetical protein